MIDIFFKGGPVMYPLLGCSIIALTVIIERVFSYPKEDPFDHRFDRYHRTGLLLGKRRCTPQSIPCGPCLGVMP